MKLIKNRFLILFALFLSSKLSFCQDSVFTNEGSLHFQKLHFQKNIPLLRLDGNSNNCNITIYDQKMHQDMIYSKNINDAFEYNYKPTIVRNGFHDNRIIDSTNPYGTNSPGSSIVGGVLQLLLDKTVNR